MTEIQYRDVEEIWPVNIPFAENHTVNYTFKVTAFEALGHMRRELDLWGKEVAVVGTSLPLSRRSDQPLWGSSHRVGPAAAVQFLHVGHPVVLVQDRYNTLDANLRTIGLTIKCMRDMERYGATQTLDRMMSGLRQIGQDQGPDHWAVLGVLPGADEDEIKRAYRIKTSDLHPDNGGSNEGFARLTDARDRALREATNG